MADSEENSANKRLSPRFNSAAEVETMREADRPLSEKHRIEREITRTAATGEDPGFIPRSDQFGHLGLQLRKLALETKKRKADFLQIIITLNLHQLAEKARELALELHNEADKWRQYQENTLDQLHQFTTALPEAEKALISGEVQRDSDGGFLNPHIQEIANLSLDYYQMKPEDLRQLTDEQAKEFIHKIISDQDRITASLTDKYQLAKEIADKLDDIKEDLGQRTKRILESGGSDQEKTQWLNALLQDISQQALNDLEALQVKNNLFDQAVSTTLDHLEKSSETVFKSRLEW